MQRFEVFLFSFCPCTVAAPRQCREGIGGRKEFFCKQQQSVAEYKVAQRGLNVGPENVFEHPLLFEWNVQHLVFVVQQPGKDVLAYISVEKGRWKVETCLFYA